MTWRCCVCQKEKPLSEVLGQKEVEDMDEGLVTYGLCSDCYGQALKDIEMFEKIKSENSALE